MSRGYSGADLIADIEVDYEYLGHDYDSFEDIANLFSINLHFAEDTNNYATNVEHIMDQAVEYARSYLEQNGNVRTGNLLDSIQKEHVSGSHWRLSAPARDERGHLYAGHIEYGFTDQAGQSHGPWPFLRPAMRVAAADSRNDLARTMQSLMLYGDPKFGDFQSGRTFQLALGRSNKSFSYSKGRGTFSDMRNAYRRTETLGGKTKHFEWGKALNGFNKDSSRNQWSISSDSSAWEWGEL